VKAGKTQSKLNNLIALYTYGVNLKKDTDYSKNHTANGMFSVSESSLKAVTGVRLEKMQVHNASHLTRVYPKGLRFGSSNYDPTPGWRSGCQLVALNWQTSDENMWWLRSKFSMNGDCGYVLKPDWMLRGESPIGRADSIELVVTVCCGGNFPSQTGDLIDPFIRIKIAGWDSANVHTKPVSDNGYDPVWNETFHFTLIDPSLDVIDFILMDKDVNADDKIGHAEFPVDALRVGYRSFSFFSVKKEERIEKSYLLCHIRKVHLKEDQLVQVEKVGCGCGCF
jgi:hypothetical protein